MRHVVLALIASLAFSVTADSQKADRALAIKQLEAGGPPLTATSRAIIAGEPIPMKYADFGEKASPDISWSGAAVNARSFAVLVEDPDARNPNLAENIPVMGKTPRP